MPAVRPQTITTLQIASLSGNQFDQRGKKFAINHRFIFVTCRQFLLAIELAEKLEVEPELLPPIRFHDLRHTHATGLLAKGYSIKAVSQRLGHGSIEITLKTYAHVLPSDDATLAEGLERMYG